MKTISWAVSPEEAVVIRQIAGRAVAVARLHGVEYTMRDAEMDITAVHANGCPLDLVGLLDAPEPDFGHDVLGIRRRVDRRTGELGGCFCPRYAMLDADAV